jgi:hypothetical protein
MSIFFQISTQDHPSLTDRKQVLKAIRPPRREGGRMLNAVLLTVSRHAGTVFGQIGRIGQKSQ